VIKGFDVSHHQNPDLFTDWNKLTGEISFIVARATYGKGTSDRQFFEFAKRARNSHITFGAYLFYRQVHSVEDQLALFSQTIERIEGFRAGELFPTLDMEENSVNGDGKPKAKHFSDSCRRIAEAWRDEYGGCILYYSSYFPEYLGGRPDWMKEDGYFHWLADYNRPAGEPRTPYTPKWHIHQPRPTKSAFYNNGKTVIDHDVINPAIEFDQLKIQSLGDGLSDEARRCEDDTTNRPGGAFPDDFYSALDLMHEGTETVLAGLNMLKRKPS